MKTHLNKLLALSSVIVLAFASCKKDSVNTTATSGTPGTLTVSASTLVLNKAKANVADTSVTFSYTAANYGFQAAVTTTLQIDSVGDNWKKPQTITFVSSKQTLSTNDFNSLLLKLNLATGKSSPVLVRISQSISGSITPITSAPITMTVTPYALISYIYVPGSYQSTITAAQWTPATADSLVSKTGNGVYTGWVYYITGGHFKITPAKNWNVGYGDAGSGKISTSGGDISAPTATGLYFVTVDMNALTISFASADHSWSVIGDAAQGWDAGNDVTMTFNQNANIYQVTTLLKSTGQLKFRADNAWALSYGDAGNNTLSTSGGNIAGPATGNYLVTLSFGDPLNPTYKLVKQ